MFNPLYVDHFTFSIDLKNNRIMIYGLLLHWSIPKRGFVMVLNKDLHIQWGKSFTPFESEGKGIITRDDGFLCRSGPYLYKLNAQGALQWATTLVTNPGIYPLAGPVEVDNGYVLEASGPGFGFFYKVDLNGKFVWKSEKYFPPPKDRRISCCNPTAIYWLPGPDRVTRAENAPCALLLSPQGAILRGQKLALDQPIDTGPLALSLDESNTVNIAGSANPYIIKPDKVTDFLLQFSLDSLSGNCFQWEPILSFAPNDVSLQFVPLDTVTVDATMNDVTAGSFLIHPLEFEIEDICDAPGPDHLITVDTMLPCDQSWQVTLPGPGFVWDDGSPDNPRLLYRAGHYQATSRSDCSRPVVYSYQLQKQVCNCSIYLPQIFSPNGDGQNDRLEFSSNCTPVEWHMQVFDRWGNQMFESRDAGLFRTALFRQKPALPGRVLCRYTLPHAGQRRGFTKWVFRAGSGGV